MAWRVTDAVGFFDEVRADNRAGALEQVPASVGTDCTITASLVQPSMRIHHLAQAYRLTE
jgi:hypothetical protein